LGKVKNPRVPSEPPVIQQKPTEFERRLSKLLDEYNFRIRDVTNSVLTIVQLCLTERKELLAKIKKLEEKPKDEST